MLILHLYKRQHNKLKKSNHKKEQDNSRNLYWKVLRSIHGVERQVIKSNKSSLLFSLKYHLIGHQKVMKLMMHQLWNLHHWILMRLKVIENNKNLYLLTKNNNNNVVKLNNNNKLHKKFQIKWMSIIFDIIYHVYHFIPLFI